MHKQIWIGWLLIPILILAFGIRIYNLSINPPELFSDEITQVLSARSIIETGKDINGKTNLFLYNKIKLGTPLYGYLAALSTYVLGNNTFSIRLPAAIAGTIFVYLIYLLVNLITRNKLASLICTFFASIIPWGIYFSRIGWEPALTMPFLLISIYSILLAIQKNSQKIIILSFCIFAFSVYASDALEFLSPLFLITILVINYRHVLKFPKIYFVAFCYFVILLVPLFYVSLTEPLKHDRVSKLSTFRTGINQESLKIFSNNYISHFKYDFLFQKGDPNLRHGTGADGVLYLILLPFIIIGFITIFGNYKDKNNLLLIFWLFYFPLGGSLTNDGVPHATRTLIGLPIFLIISAIGLVKIFEIIKNKNLIRITIVIVIFFSFIHFYRFINNYFKIYPISSQSWWEYGQKEVYDSVKSITQGDESLCLSNIDYWHEETLNHYYLGIKYNFKVLYDLNDPNCLKSEILVLPANLEIPSNYQLKKTIYDLEKKPKWIVYKSLNSYKE